MPFDDLLLALAQLADCPAHGLAQFGARQFALGRILAARVEPIVQRVELAPELTQATCAHQRLQPARKSLNLAQLLKPREAQHKGVRHSIFRGVLALGLLPRPAKRRGLKRGHDIAEGLDVALAR